MSSNMPETNTGGCHVFDFHKPEWLYEALPYVYVIAGAATIANLGSILSLASGILLISAGVFIWWMRRSYRQDNKSVAIDRRAAERRSADRLELNRRNLVRRQAERRGR